MQAPSPSRTWTRPSGPTACTRRRTGRPACRASRSTTAGSIGPHTWRRSRRGSTQIRALLAPHGSVVIHVDPKTSHYVKVLADEIFGEDAFASEIVWRYRRWPSKTPNFQRVHDVLLRYRTDAGRPPGWNPLYEPLAAVDSGDVGDRPSSARSSSAKRQAGPFVVDRASRRRESRWATSGRSASSRRSRASAQDTPRRSPRRSSSAWSPALSDPGDLVLDPVRGQRNDARRRREAGAALRRHRPERRGDRDHPAAPRGNRRRPRASRRRRTGRRAPRFRRLRRAARNAYGTGSQGAHGPARQEAPRGHPGSGNHGLLSRPMN